jgi:hypothetical protein
MFELYSKLIIIFWKNIVQSGNLEYLKKQAHVAGADGTTALEEDDDDAVPDLVNWTERSI